MGEDERRMRGFAQGPTVATKRVLHNSGGDRQWFQGPRHSRHNWSREQRMINGGARSRLERRSVIAVQSR